MDPLAELFDRYAARGDVSALGEVFDRTAPKLLHLAMHLASTAEDAEDLLQATFVLAMRKGAAFDRAQPLLPWLSGILAGEARNLARKNQRRRVDELPELAAEDGGPVAAAERRELVAQLREHVEALPGEQRQALLLQLQHGLSPASIAEVLDVPPGTVRMRLHRGLQALRKLLPSGLALWLVGALGTRGLAAVRVAVLREAGALRAAPLGGAAAVAAGVMTMKYVFAGVAVLLAAALCWWWLAPPAAVAPLAAPTRTAAAAVTDARAPAAITAAPDRVAANETIPPPESGTGSLRVVVTSASSGRPIVDLSVRIWQGSDQRSVDGTARHLRTDTSGTVHLEALAPGEWQVEPLGCDAEATGVQIHAGAETAHTIDLAARALRGVVVDEHGAPVSGAAIRIATDNSMGRFSEDLVRPDVSGEALARTAAISASDGTFACDAGPGEAHVAAAHPQYTSSHTQLTNAAGLDQWRFALRPRTREIRGVVLDSSRQPIAGASVEARVFERPQRNGDGTWLGPILVEFATTGADGRFVFGMLPPGSTRLEASAKGRRRGTHGTSKQNDDVELVLGNAVEIVGTVREADGTPFRSGHVYVLSGAKGPMVGQAVVHSGRFFVRNLPLPPLKLAVYGGSGTMPVLKHPLEHCAAVTHVELVLPARPSLGGVVVDDAGRPLAKWTVAAYRLDLGPNPLFVEQATTEVDGRFALRQLRGDTFRVAATWPAGDPAKPAVARDDVPLLGGEVVLRVPADRLPRASVAGRLVDHTGNAIGNATVQLATGRTTHREVATDDRGSFRIGAIPAGTYALVLQQQGQPVRTVRSLTLAVEQALELGDVQLLPMATLRVEVVQRDLTPWPNMLPDVWLQRAGDSIPEWLPQRAGNGFEGAVEPGAVRIAVSDPDLIAAPQDVELLPGERRVVQVVVTIGRSVALAFEGYDDPDTIKIDPKDRLHVEIADKSGAVVLRTDLRRSRHGGGNWSLEHTFPFGEYTVTAHTDSGRRYRGAFAATDTMRDRGITVPRQP